MIQKDFCLHLRILFKLFLNSSMIKQFPVQTKVNIKIIICNLLATFLKFHVLV